MPTFDSFSAFLQICFGLNTLLGAYRQLTNLLIKHLNVEGRGIEQERELLVSRLDGQDQATFVNQYNNLTEAFKALAASYLGWQTRAATFFRWIAIVFTCICTILLYMHHTLDAWYAVGNGWVWILIVPLPAYYLVAYGTFWTFLWFYRRERNQLISTYQKYSKPRYTIDLPTR